MSENPSASMRQISPDLQTALRTAVTHFRAIALDYRQRQRGRLHKAPRKNLAATYDDWARILEQHADAMLAERLTTRKAEAS